MKEKDKKQEEFEKYTLSERARRTNYEMFNYINPRYIATFCGL